MNSPFTPKQPSSFNSSVAVSSVARPRTRLAFLRDGSTYLLLLLLALLGALVYQFVSALRIVTINLNDQQIALLSRQTTVRGALAEAGITLDETDLVTPARDGQIPADGQIVIRLAQTVLLDVDGQTYERRTQSATVDAFLQENAILIKPNDRITLDGRIVDLQTPLPHFANALNRSAIPINQNVMTHLLIQRAVPVTVNDDGALTTLFTTEPTLGQALRQAGMLVYLGDYVTPDLGEPTSAGRTIFIQRSQPATIIADGKMIFTRTRANSVAGLLAQEGIELISKDFTEPNVNEPLRANMTVNVTRVREEFKEQAEPIRFETLYEPDPELEIDNEVVTQVGLDGIKKKLIKSVFYNGVLKSQGVEREWIDKEKQDKLIHYGTKIVERPITLPDGTVATYWRKMQVLATSYTAATSGKRADHPQYGITFTGLRAGKGIIAVDPRLIPLKSYVYVPGYGSAIAGDTGGAIIGRHVDLGYDEWNLVLWFDYVDIYLLSPIPPRSQINYRLPALPTKRSFNAR